MSSPLAVGAVSAVLRNLLDSGFVEAAAPMGSITVTAIAPDRVVVDDPDANPSLNLFLHRVSENPGWRNADLPSVDPDGTRRTRPPLALDLHYLLTAYGSADFQAEILLGYAMHVLHERPVLDRAAIRTALDPTPLGPSILPPAFQALTASDLADQVEAVTVTQEPLDTEELARLWAATQAPYRPTVGYLVSVVLIESTAPTRPALPVLSRGRVDEETGRETGFTAHPSLVPPFPTVLSADPPAGGPAARLGETLTLRGHHLDGEDVVVRFAHRLLDSAHEVTVGTVTDPRAVEVPLPSGAGAEAAWPAGLWTVTVSVLRLGEDVARETAAAAFLLAPEPLLPPTSVTRDAGTGEVGLVLGVRPQVRPGQPVRLALGAVEAAPDLITSATSTLELVLPPVPPGPQWLRLRVDGVESVLVLRTEPPAFDPSQVVSVPA